MAILRNIAIALLKRAGHRNIAKATANSETIPARHSKSPDPTHANDFADTLGTYPIWRALYMSLGAAVINYASNANLRMYCPFGEVTVVVAAQRPSRKLGL